MQCHQAPFLFCRSNTFTYIHIHYCNRQTNWFITNLTATLLCWDGPFLTLCSTLSGCAELDWQPVFSKWAALSCTFQLRQLRHIFQGLCTHGSSEINNFFGFQQMFHQKSWLTSPSIPCYDITPHRPAVSMPLNTAQHSMLRWNRNSGYLTADSYYKNRCLHSWRHASWEAFFCSRHSPMKGALKLTFSNRLFSFEQDERQDGTRSCAPQMALSHPLLLNSKTKNNIWYCIYAVSATVWSSLYGRERTRSGGKMQRVR